MKKILVIGSLNMDIVANMDKMPIIGETVLGNQLTYSHGGKGANQACACARMGGNTVMLGCVGNDDAGKSIVENLEKAQVVTDGIEVIPDEVTGTAIIFIDSKANNSIVVIPGANQNCNVNYLKKYDHFIMDCDILLIQLEIPIHAVSYAIKIAKEAGKTVILNPAPAPTVELQNDVLYNIDILTPNESELQTLTKKPTGTLEEIEVAAKELLHKGVKHVIVTAGEDGAIWASESGCIHIPTRAVEAVDTTAAGDCFNGTLAAVLAEGYGLEEAIHRANVAASISVTRYGAQSSLPKKEEVEAVAGVI